MIKRLLEKYLSFPDLRKIDLLFLSLFISLTFFGLLAVATASIEFSNSLTGDPFHFFTKQSIHLLIGFILFVLIISVPLNFWEKFDRILLGFGIFFLIIIFIPGLGIEVNGALRWLRIG
ncbi:uncharacterized protein METZ01_LOCUS153857, partial [marine metagenome]